ncbi:lipase member H-A-like [Photinus pyralis]|uniref:lipase member H-A-like n=1 Tax=Photinus pyralis TaxID=7054 RepID=UPI00126749D2|nr:lipase member H-A-like [Photinus pyralis]
MAALYILIFSTLLVAVCSKMCGRTSGECLDLLRPVIWSIAQNCTDDDGILTQYWWHTPTNAVQINSVTEIDKVKPIIFLLHGWAGSRDVDYIKAIRDAYLERYQSNRTIITLDFGMYVAGDGILTYANAFCNAPAVAMGFGKFLCNLDAYGVSPKNIHVVGHSLGAQIAGMAGAYIKQNCNRSVARITGLDPASIGYLCAGANECRLDETDADFVDVIHTDSGGYGTTFNSGHTDFYPNNGIWQPNCVDLKINYTQILLDPLSVVLTPVSCSHQRSCFLFAESIRLNSFPAEFCLLLSFKVRYMGEYCKPELGTRMCGLRTNGQSPYGRGPNGPLN